VRHHTEYVALPVQDAGDVSLRAVARGPVTECNAILGLQFIQRPVVSKVVPLAVRDRDPKHLALVREMREGGVCRSYDQVDRFADELQILITQQSARQHSAFGQNLKAVAKTHDKPAIGCELLHRLNHG
jgi:hypothetical protein